MMDCQTTLATLHQLFIERAPIAEQALVAAQEHLHHCPTCQAKVARLVQAIQTVDITAINCAACRDSLPDYLVISQEDPELPDEYLPVALHLLECDACAAEFAILADTMAVINAGQLLPPFPLETIWRQMTKTLHKLFTDVVISVRRGNAQFGAMLAPLQPVAVMGGARERNDLQTPAQRLDLHTTPSGLSLTLETRPKAEQGVILYVAVKEAQTESAVANLRVRLYDNEHRLRQSLLTEADGAVLFNALQPGRYLLQIRQQEQYEEVPILIVDANR